MMAKKNTKNILSTETVTEPLPTALVTQLPTSNEVNPREIANIIAECTRQGADLPYLVGKLVEGTKATKITVDKFGDEHVEVDTANVTKNVLILLEMQGYIKVKGTTTENKSYTQINVKWGE